MGRERSHGYGPHMGMGPMGGMGIGMGGMGGMGMGIGMGMGGMNMGGMGRWMMRLPAGMDTPKASQARRDLERLLRASASWDTPGR